MRRRQIALLLGILGFAVIAANADDFWQKKDSAQWSKEECKKILTDSPWARRVIVENSSQLTSAPSASRDASNPGGANYGTGEIDYRVQVRSAEPVRQALIRQQRLDQNYDAKSADEKKALDAKLALDFPAAPDDLVAVHVLYSSTKDEISNVLTQSWRGVAEGSVPPDLCLIGEGNKKTTAVKFVASQETTEFDVLFPRSAVGSAKSLKIQIPTPAMGDFGAKLTNVEFKLDKMTYNGKPSF